MNLTEKEINEYAKLYNVPESATYHLFTAESRYGFGDIIEEGVIDISYDSEENEKGNQVEKFLCFRF